ncbi:MAG TPA: hypothetical protein VKT77_20605 [Chthonomonadaceae bacterium]|nr:hypothetical protein [Chthonomonadaceae bacterium]
MQPTNTVDPSIARARRPRRGFRSAAGVVALLAALGVVWTLLPPAERTVYGPPIDASGQRCAFQLSARWTSRDVVTNGLQPSPNGVVCVPKPPGRVQQLLARLFHRKPSMPGATESIGVFVGYAGQRPKALPESDPRMVAMRKVGTYNPPVGTVTGGRVYADNEVTMSWANQVTHFRSLTILPDGAVRSYRIETSSDAAHADAVRADVDRILRTFHMVGRGTAGGATLSGSGR